MSLTAPERETIISFSDDGEKAWIYTAQRPVITRLKKNPSAALIDEGVFEGTAWAKFEIPKTLVSFRTGRAKRQLTEEQRRAIGERMNRAKRQG